jgi:hypothetical protein
VTLRGVVTTLTERKMHLRLSFSGFVFALMISTLGASAVNQSDTAALEAAQKWLAIVDQGAYARSWQDAAGFLKSNVTQERFAQQLTNVRKPLGTVVSRKILTKKFNTSPSGASDGKSMVIQFQTSFTGKKGAEETVTPALEKDGQWRVTGYWIK